MKKGNGLLTNTGRDFNELFRQRTIIYRFILREKKAHKTDQTLTSSDDEFLDAEEGDDSM